MIETSKNSKFKLLILTVSLIICIISATIINFKFPSYINHEYRIKENFSLDNIQYNIDSISILSYNDFRKQYPSMIIENSNQYFILIEMNVHNTTNSDQDVKIEQFRLETEGWSSNASIKPLFYLNNSLSSYSYKLSSDESSKIHLPFAYYCEDNIDPCEEMKKNKKYSLCLYMNYPDKISVIFD